jgi:hypothetical protein
MQNPEGKNGEVQPVAGRSGLLVRWNEVEYIDVLEV